MNRNRFLSIFSGIGGFDLGLERAGMECAGQVEIDEKCRRVLARHWPDVPWIGDVRGVQGDEFGPVGLVCGGSPCQDLSVAGRRAGLAGRRSGLFYNFVRIADANPGAWVLFENVPGLLSVHGGRDFSEALFQLTGFRPSIPKGGWRSGGVCVGPKRTACWRVLDAQYFGLAQRRKRVFIVCGPADGRGPVSVLFEPESCTGDPPPKREKGTIAPAISASGTGTSRTARSRSEADFCIVESQIGIGFPDPAYTLAAGSGGSKFGSGRDGQDTFVVEDVAKPLLAGGNDRHAKDLMTYVTEVGTGHVAIGSNVFPPLRGFGHGWQGQHNSDAATAGLVRRLTPVECCRLQGFPDDHLRMPEGEKQLKETTRYMMLGNAVAVPVVEWIGRRIVEEMGKP